MKSGVPEHYWACDANRLLDSLVSHGDGLTSRQAALRLSKFGRNDMGEREGPPLLRLLWRQFSSPLVLILVAGAALSFFLRQWTDGSIILLIVVASALLGFVQEYRASSALAALKKRLALTTSVRRDGRVKAVPSTTVVPGDVVVLSAGNLVPADGVILTSRDFLVSEAVLTGESMPVEKMAGVSDAGAPLAQRHNCVFAGSSVRSGAADVLIVNTGRRSALGDVVSRIESLEPETEFERGVRRFGYLLIRVMLVMVLFVLVVSQALDRPIVESLLFAVALAVGMTPELLPAIVTVTLSAGARQMAREGVIVRRLEAIENLGSIDILCTDKTGTLTEGNVTLAAALDLEGKPDDAVQKLAYLNSAFETGIENPLDQAICAAGEKAGNATAGFTKIDEIPYDFVRKRLTVVVAEADAPARNCIVTKGAFATVLKTCTLARISGNPVPLDAALQSRILALFDTRSEEGFRIMAVATRDIETGRRYGVADERDMVLEGLLLFADPPKPEARQAIADLAALGISLKMISGDSRLVNIHVAKALGLRAGRVVSGAEIAAMSPEALEHEVDHADLFVEVDPQQKERIIRALQKRGHAVGYLGDGINDAPALHAADVGISVEQAVDVARQSADIVLLKRDLAVLRLGIESGRRSFANTLKYISITISANFGNMVSMAIATPFLPFLPLLAKQILLNNFLSDLPSVTISADRVDARQVMAAERWNIAEVRRFMIVFGLVSSAFDLLTFFLLIKVLDAGENTFQTAWFIVSLLTEVAVVMVLRTRGCAFRSRPGGLLAGATAAVFAAALSLPYLPPFDRLFGFTPLPLATLASLLAIVAAYIVATEFAKRLFYRTVHLGSN